MIQKRQKRFDLDIDDLRAQDLDLAKYIIDNPSNVIRFMEGHLNRGIDELLGGDLKQKGKQRSVQ